MITVHSISKDPYTGETRDLTKDYPLEEALRLVERTKRLRQRGTYVEDVWCVVPTPTGDVLLSSQEEVLEAAQ